jgi:prenyltransferase beta subunit
MKEGAFINDLTQARIAASLLSSYEAGTTLAVVKGLGVVDAGALTDFVANCQTSSGGFTPTPQETTEDYGSVEDAVRLLDQLGALHVIDCSKAVEWAMNCYRPSDGGFNDRPGGSSPLIWPVRALVGVLHRLDALYGLDSQRTIEYTMAYYKPEGGFSDEKNGLRSLGGTRCGVFTLWYLGAMDRISTAATTSFVMSFYDAEIGAFGLHGATLAETHIAIGILEKLGQLNQVNATRTSEYVLACQSHLHGAFACTPSDASDPVNEQGGYCFFAADVLRALGKLGLLEELFTVQEAPIWTGDDTPPTTDSSSLPPPGPEFWAMAAIVAVAGSVFLVVFAWGMTHRRPSGRHIVKRVKRRHRR